MLVLIGYAIVVGSVFGGYALAGGHPGAMYQPLELLMIGGILLAHGFVAPLVSVLEARLHEATKALECVKATLLASLSPWELSTDRANASRRGLVAGGMDEAKVLRVVGLASSLPFDAADPLNPVDRRISLVVLNEATERQIRGEAP